MPLLVGESPAGIHRCLSAPRHVKLLDEVAEVVADGLVAEIQRDAVAFPASIVSEKCPKEWTV